MSGTTTVKISTLIFEFEGSNRFTNWGWIMLVRALVTRKRMVLKSNILYCHQHYDFTTVMIIEIFKY